MSRLQFLSEAHLVTRGSESPLVANSGHKEAHRRDWLGYAISVQFLSRNRTGEIMSEGSATRRLAAIVAIDVAGYSRLMGTDEDGTLAALKGHRKNRTSTPRKRIFQEKMPECQRPTRTQMPGDTPVGRLVCLRHSRRARRQRQSLGASRTRGALEAVSRGLGSCRPLTLWHLLLENALPGRRGSVLSLRRVRIQKSWVKYTKTVPKLTDFWQGILERLRR